MQIVSTSDADNVSLISKETLYEKIQHIKFAYLRAISSPTPFLISRIPIIGGRSIVELVLIIVVIIIALSTTVPDGASVGHVADYLGVATILLGLRNNVLNFLLGISFERAIYWHKMCAAFWICVIIIHGSLSSFDSSGIVSACLMGVMSLVYLIKDINFEAFYYIHILTFLAFIPIVFLHNAHLTGYAATLWGVDILIRYVLIGRRKTVKALILPGNVIRLTFNEIISHQSGQFIFICIPEISIMEYHPFSISSSPDMTTTIHIRSLGDWTRRLYEHVNNRTSNTKDNDPENIGIEVTMRVEGPYGSPSVSFLDPSYQVDLWKVLVLISGGIGITPLQSIRSDIIRQHNNGRKSLRKVLLIWSVKDRALLGSFGKSNVNENGDFYLPRSFQPPVRVDPADRYDQEFVNVDENNDSVLNQSIFQSEFHLTSVRDKNEFQEAGIDPVVQRNLKFGRPNIPEILDSVKKFTIDEKLFSRVAVFVCGPQNMVDTVDDFCRRSKMNCDMNAVRFDCHKEVFNF